MQLACSAYHTNINAITILNYLISHFSCVIDTLKACDGLRLPLRETRLQMIQSFVSLVSRPFFAFDSLGHIATRKRVGTRKKLPSLYEHLRETPRYVDKIRTPPVCILTILIR